MNIAKLVRGATVVAAVLTAQMPIATAQTTSTENPVVTLKSFDGFTQLRGKLIDFDGSKFTIETVLGVIQVDALQVNCEGEACPQNLMFGAAFGVHGSNTIGAELMPTLIEGYADSLDAELISEVGQGDLESTLRVMHADGREMAAIDLISRGSSSAFQSLAGRTADIGMASRRARDTDMTLLRGSGFPELRGSENEHVIALDGLIVVTHPSNPIQSISMEEVALIYSGTIQNWSDVGGPDRPINLYARDEDSGTFQTFRSLIMRPAGVEISPSAQRFASNTQLSDSVSRDPDAIGVTAIAYQRATKALPIRQSCGILSRPTTFAMKTEEYPLARRLYLYTPPSNIAAHAKQIVEFAMSDEAQPLIAESGFVNQEVERLSIDNQGGRIIYAMTGEAEVSMTALRGMLTELKEAERLSTTFRFTPGSSDLTAVSQRAAEKMARDLADGVYDDKEVMLLGFTDSVGQFSINLGLGERRALVVEERIRAAAGDRDLSNALVTVRGYGELMPVGCNTTALGRSTNRRVEVWIRDRQG